MGKHLVKWTPELEQFLIDNYATMTAEEIAGRIGSTAFSVMEKARRMGISKRKVKEWTVSEEGIAVMCWRSGMTPKAIAEKLLRSRESIVSKLKVLGVWGERYTAAKPKREHEIDDEPTKAIQETLIAPGHRVIRFGQGYTAAHDAQRPRSSMHHRFSSLELA